MTFIEYIHKELNNDAMANGLPFEIFSKRIKKGETLTNIGSIEKNIYFLKEGIIEAVLEPEKGEIVFDIFFKSELFSSMSSYLSNTPSDVKLSALIDSEVDYVVWEDLFKAMDASHDLCKLGLREIQKFYTKRVKREKDLLVKSATERYLDLFEQHRNYIQLIPVHKLASFIGVRPESLSRIRKKVFS